MGSVGELSKFAHRLFWNACIWHVLVDMVLHRPWTDLLVLIYSSHMWTQTLCHVWNTAQQCRSGLFQDSDFARDLGDSKSTSGGLMCIFGRHTFVPISWMCKKQTSVSQSSTEAEVISLECRFTHGWDSPALDLKNLVIEVFHSSPNQINKTKGCQRATVKPVGNSSIKHAKTNSNHEHQSGSDQHWSRSIKRNTFWFQCNVVCLWR